MKILEGKNAIITGASKGIGRRIAEVFTEQGANVAFTYLSSVEKGQALEKELASKGGKVKGYRSDASKFNDAQELIDNVLEDFGSIDIVVNNAGITQDGLLMRMSEEQFDRVIEVNLKSVFNITKAVLKPMMKQKFGSIVNMSSIVGEKGNSGQANYAASKAGMVGFTKSVALELGSRNIRCNAIAPGFIATEMTDALDDNILNEWKKGIPMKKIGETDDVAQAAVFLASDMSKYVTGQVLHVNGGLYT